MSNKNKKQKDEELRGDYTGIFLTPKQKKEAKKALVKAKELEKQIIKNGAKWIKTFRGYKLVKV